MRNFMFLLFSKFLLIIIICELGINSTTQNEEIRLRHLFHRGSINISVQKCYCKAGEVWDTQRCVEKETYVSMVNFNPWIERIVNSKSLDVSAISRVQCNADQLLVPLKGGTFFIVGKGDLFHLYTGLIYQKGNYCIEHVTGRHGNLRLDALVCVTRPSVPRCCPESHYLDNHSYHCIFDPNAHFNPPISKEPAILRWGVVDGPHTGFPYCHDTEIYNQVDLENRTEAALLYRSNGIFLHWKAAPFDFPYIVGPDDYCVALEKKGLSFHHSAFYCDEPVPLRMMPKLAYNIQNKYNPELYLFSVIMLPVPNN